MPTFRRPIYPIFPFLLSMFGTACSVDAGSVTERRLVLERADHDELRGRFRSEAATLSFEAHRVGDGIAIAIASADEPLLAVAPGDAPEVAGVRLPEVLARDPEATAAFAAFLASPARDALLELGDELADVDAPAAVELIGAVVELTAQAEDAADAMPSPTAPQAPTGELTSTPDPDELRYYCDALNTPGFCDAVFQVCDDEASEPFSDTDPFDCVHQYNACMMMAALCRYVY